MLLLNLSWLLEASILPASFGLLWAIVAATHPSVDKALFVVKFVLMNTEKSSIICTY